MSPSATNAQPHLDEAPVLDGLQAQNDALRADVAELTEALRRSEQRIETALALAGVTAFEQDENFRYLWAHNPPWEYPADGMVGKTETDFMPPDLVELVRALKRQAFVTGETQRLEFRVGPAEDSTWYEVNVRPIERDGRTLLVGAGANITQQKRHQQRLEEVTRELNHRSKNLLTMVQGIARQTALTVEDPGSFVDRFGERLRALAAAHDVLVETEWRGADIRDVIEGQLRHHREGAPERIRMIGEPFQLSPSVAHYVGLAIHELGSNAVKYGALSGPRGRVEVAWGTHESVEGGRELMMSWRESGGPRVAPSDRRGFGRTILESLTPRAMRGDAVLAFPETGVVWTLTAPV